MDRLLAGDVERYGAIRQGSMAQCALRLIGENPGITQHRLAKLLKAEGWSSGGYSGWAGAHCASKLWGNGLVDMDSQFMQDHAVGEYRGGMTVHHEVGLYRREFKINALGTYVLGCLEKGAPFQPVDNINGYGGSANKCRPRKWFL